MTIFLWVLAGLAAVVILPFALLGFYIFWHMR